MTHNKSQISTKSQISNSKRSLWSLDFRSWNLFGACDLKLGASRQKGVTLLISVLIMSAVTLITVTVSYFAFQELRSSRAVALSEPAIMAAETAGEQGVWALKRSSTINLCTSGKQTTILNNSNTVISNCVFYSGATFDIKSGTPFSFYLYDPNDINGNLTPGYNFITLTNKSSQFLLFITVQTLDGQTFINNQAINPQTSVVVPASQNLPSISPGSDERYKVILSSNGDITADVTTNLGLPDFPTVDAEGCSSRSNLSTCDSNPEAYKRRINIVVPQ